MQASNLLVRIKKVNQIATKNVEEHFDKNKNFLFIALISMNPGLYLLILLMFNWLYSTGSAQESTPKPWAVTATQWVITNLNLVVLVTGGISILVIIITHRYWLKLFHQKFDLNDPYERFMQFFILLGVNTVIVFFGFIISFFILVSTHTLNWYYLIGYFGVGWGNVVYIYGWKTPAIYRKFSTKSPMEKNIQSDSED